MGISERFFVRLVALLIIVCGVIGTPGWSAFPVFAAPFSTIHLPANTISDPSDIVVSQRYVWIPMFSNNTVVELNAATGKLEEIFDSKAAKLSAPNSVGVEGDRLWVSNSSSGGVSEIDYVKHTLVRSIRAPGGCLKSPVKLLAETSQVWVLSSASQCLLKIDPSSGAVELQVHLRGGKVTPTAIYGPVSVVITGRTIWVSEVLLHSERVIGLSTGTGALLYTKTFGSSRPNDYFGQMTATASRVYVTLSSGNGVASFASDDAGGSTLYNSASYHFDGVKDLATARGEVWAANGTSGSVTEIRAANGSYVANHKLVNPARAALSSLAIFGDTGWVVNSLGSVIEFQTSSGLRIRTIS